MDKRKNLLIVLGEWWEQRHTWPQITTSDNLNSHRQRLLRRLGRHLIPNIGTLIMVAILLLAIPSIAAPLRGPDASSTSTISYQGRLADAMGNPLTGYYNIEFRIYDVPSGGVPLWEEFWTGANSVAVSDGLFNVMLGSLSPGLAAAIEGYNELYLGITVGTDSEMVPRVQLGSVPFSFQALTVADGSITTEKVAERAVTDAWYLAPTSADTLPPGTNWTTIADTSLTFSLSHSAKVFFSYSVNVQPSVSPINDFLTTRLVVDGTPYSSSGSLYQPYSQGDSNVNMNGNLLVDLGPGQHTVELQWSSGGDTTSWETNPAWAGNSGARSITVIALYR